MSQDSRAKTSRKKIQESRLLVGEHVLSFRNEVQGTDREIFLVSHITRFLTSVRNDTRQHPAPNLCPLPSDQLFVIIGGIRVSSNRLFPKIQEPRHQIWHHVASTTLSDRASDFQSPASANPTLQKSKNLNPKPPSVNSNGASVNWCP